eukprot:Clim_evm44s235 gene=Clim_evmTU44s235
MGVFDTIYRPSVIPQPRGPYPVGYLDVELDLPASACADALGKRPSQYKVGDAISLTERGDPTLNGDNISIKLYYPAHDRAVNPSLSTNYAAWCPESHYGEGLARLLHYWTRLPDWLTGSVMPTLMNRVRQNSRHNVVPLRPQRGGNKYPVMVISHGLMAFATNYSQIASEFASRGMIVVCLEHRDGSAMSTADQGGENVLKFAIYNRERYGGADMMHHFNMKLHRRIDECLMALQALKGINAGESYALDNLRANLAGDGVSRNILEGLIGTMDFSTAVVAGHSYGGATAIGCSLRDSRFKVALAWDAWMQPLLLNYPDYKGLKGDPKAPILFINNGRFQWQSNINDMFNLLQKGKTRFGRAGKAGAVATLPTGYHLYPCDYPGVLGTIGTFIHDTTLWGFDIIGGKESLEIFVSLSVSFMGKHGIHLPEADKAEVDYLDAHVYPGAKNPFPHKVYAEL